jgi:hypothetical protein
MEDALKNLLLMRRPHKVQNGKKTMEKEIHSLMKNEI